MLLWWVDRVWLLNTHPDVLPLFQLKKTGRKYDKKAQIGSDKDRDITLLPPSWPPRGCYNQPVLCVLLQDEVSTDCISFRKKCVFLRLLCGYLCAAGESLLHCLEHLLTLFVLWPFRAVSHTSFFCYSSHHFPAFWPFWNQFSPRCHCYSFWAQLCPTVGPLEQTEAVWNCLCLTQGSPGLSSQTPLPPALHYQSPDVDSKCSFKIIS